MKKLLQAVAKLFNLVVLTKEEYKKLIDGPPKVGGEPIKPTTLLNYSEVVTMLLEYDKTRFELLVNGLGFEDTRVNTFDFEEVKNYLAYTENLANKLGVTLKGISFIKGVYTKKNEAYHKKDFISYENLMYLPTAIINGKEIPIDLAHSSRNNIVSFKDMLAKNGYKWRYDNEENFILRKNSIEKEQIKNSITNEIQLRADSDDSIVANFSHVKPPKA